MLFISSRAALDDDNKLGTEDMFWDVRIQRSMCLRKSQLEGGMADLQAALAGKKVLVLVHGYNNVMDDVIRAYGIVQDKVRQFMRGVYDEIVGYTWPGGDDRLDYFAAKTRSGAVAPRFCENIRLLTAKASDRPKALDVMTHSMGSRVALEALKHLRRRNAVRNLLLMASAVDNESLELNQEYFAPAKITRNAFVFHSRYDPVLALAYRLAEWDAALGQNGPENPGDIMRNSPQTFVVNCKYQITQHGQYKSTDDIYRYLARNVDTVRAPQFSTL